MNRVCLLVIPALSLACERAELLGRFQGAVGQGGHAGAGGAGATAGGTAAAGAGGTAAAGAGGEGPSVPEPVAPVSDPVARDTDPTFTADRTLLYFMSTRTGSKQIWQSERSDPADPWGAPTLVDGIDTGGLEENPRVSGDGLRLWFFSNRDRTVSDLWEATRAARSDPWGTPTPLPELSVAVRDVSAGMNESATIAVVSGIVTDSVGYDLFIFERATADEPFGEPTPLTELNSASDDYDPCLSPNGLALIFDSNRLGTYDIFLARRTSTSAPFEAPVRLDFNTVEFGEEAPHLASDPTYLMYSSDRLGTADIYETTLFQ